MKIVIGIQSCNRLDFTKRVVDSILKWNPEAIDMPWVFSDDGSTDGTQEYIMGLITNLNLDSGTVFLHKQSGITKAMERLVNEAVFYGDVLLYIQNDWEQIRRIDFNGIEKFYNIYPNAGHLHTTKYKGKDGKGRPSSTAKLINLYTREEIIPGEAIKLGDETIIPGNWHYCDLPGFTRLELAVRMFDNMVINIDAEGIRTRNVHESGYDNYLLENQPFVNIDYGANKKTPGRKY